MTERAVPDAWRALPYEVKKSSRVEQIAYLEQRIKRSGRFRTIILVMLALPCLVQIAEVLVGEQPRWWVLRLVFWMGILLTQIWVIRFAAVSDRELLEFLRDQ